jgi:diphosphomevalonate decarboxylase
VSSKAKSVSSSIGHRLMKTNPYASVRYKVANANLNELLHVLRSGNEDGFARITENEALNLHAMFLTSSPGYMLFLPGTLEIINKIREFRANTGLFLCFTLDAGPNVHILYPKSIQSIVHEFIKTELLEYCENSAWIDDELGNGPVQLSGPGAKN